MPETASARVAEVGAPEPGLTPQEIIARAQTLIPQIRDQQDEAERLGHHTELSRRWAEDSEPCTREADVRPYAMTTAAELARVHFGLPDGLF